MVTKESSESSVIEQSREQLFVLVLLLGAIVFALGTAFLILGVTMKTTPPAPYFETFTDKLLVIGGSAVSIIVGLGMIRGALRLGGWR